MKENRGRSPTQELPSEFGFPGKSCQKGADRLSIEELVRRPLRRGAHVSVSLYNVKLAVSRCSERSCCSNSQSSFFSQISRPTPTSRPPDPPKPARRGGDLWAAPSRSSVLAIRPFRSPGATGSFEKKSYSKFAQNLRIAFPPQGSHRESVHYFRRMSRPSCVASLLNSSVRELENRGFSAFWMPQCPCSIFLEFVQIFDWPVSGAGLQP